MLIYELNKFIYDDIYIRANTENVHIQQLRQILHEQFIESSFGRSLSTDRDTESLSLSGRVFHVALPRYLNV